MPDEIQKPKLFITHAFSTRDVDDDGVKRCVVVRELSNKDFDVVIETYRVKDAPPFVTSLRLSPVALGLLSTALYEATHNMHRWKFPEATEGERSQEVV